MVSRASRRPRIQCTHAVCAHLSPRPRLGLLAGRAHTHIRKMVQMVIFCYRWAGRTRPFLGVARLETAKNSVHARCMRPLVAAPPPRSACRPRTHTVPAHGDPQRHVLLARAQAQANPHHSRHCAPASAAETRQHRTRGRSGMMTLHWSRTTASHAGITSKAGTTSKTKAAASYARTPT